jgi:hypothetical protein
MERQGLTLEPIELPPADPPQARGRLEVEEQREVGKDAAGGVDVQLADQVDVQAPSVPLIGQRGVDVAIAEHDPALLEPGADALADVLLARGQEEEQLTDRYRPQARALEEAPDGQAERGAIGLRRPLDPRPLSLQPSPEARELGGLARPLDALERDQHTAHARDLPTVSVTPSPRHCNTPGLTAREGGR